MRTTRQTGARSLLDDCGFWVRLPNKHRGGNPSISQCRTDLSGPPALGLSTPSSKRVQTAQLCSATCTCGCVGATTSALTAVRSLLLLFFFYTTLFNKKIFWINIPMLPLFALVKHHQALPCGRQHRTRAASQASAQGFDAWPLAC